MCSSALRQPECPSGSLRQAPDVAAAMLERAPLSLILLNFLEHFRWATTHEANAIFPTLH